MDRKEARRQYKETVPPMGIFQIKNLENGRIFIGSAVDIHGRINRIRFQLENRLFPDKRIQEDYDKAGAAGFACEVLDYLEAGEDRTRDYGEELKTLEEMWLEKLQPYDEKGYHKRKD